MTHACSFFESGTEQIAQAMPHVLRGLEAGGRCIVVADKDAIQAWESGLRKLHVEVERSEEEGALQFVDLADWPMRDTGNSMLRAREAWDVLERALERYSSLTIVVDMSWTLQARLSADQLCHWEATLDYLLSDDLPVYALCQYDRYMLPAGALHAAMRTHRETHLGGQRIINPFFEAPAILEHEPHLNACDSNPRAIERMFKKLLESS